MSFLFLMTGRVGFAQMPGMAPKEEKYPNPEHIDELPALVEPMAWWVLALLILGGLLLLGLLVWLVMKERPPKAAAKPPALRIALAKLNRLKEQLSELEPSEIAHQVSVILREYQMKRYGVPAPYRASEELYRDGRLQTNPALKPRLEPLAALHDRLAFAPQPSTRDEAGALIEESVKALEQEDPDKVYQKQQRLLERENTPKLGFTVRRYFFTMAWLLVAAGVCMLFLPLMPKARDMEWWYGALFAIPWWLMAGFSYFKGTKTDPRQKEFGLSADASVAEQRRFYIAGLCLVPLASGVLTYFVIRQLNVLEHGTVESVRVWAPVALAYQLVGYWGGVLVVPLLALISVVRNAFRLAVLKTDSPKA